VTTTRPWPTPGPDARDLIIRDPKRLERFKWRALFGPNIPGATKRLRQHEIALAANAELAAVVERRNARAESRS
jgi:hypothetical protein